jgi:ADP-ribose pyrophosphatase YjhB (NUDIX family)
MINQFIIRVYGLILNKQQEVLVTDEYQLNTPMTKFPGGGLEFGEGPIDCLRREIWEECNQEITGIKHFYTTDYFQQALFYENAQLISIYYTAQLNGAPQFRISTKAFDFPEQTNGNQSFRWIPVDQLNPDDFTFPIDKHVAFLLKSSINQIR